jgi:hypothetical protein
MNKRLKELAEQAGLDPCVFYDNLLRISDFAELVRQEEREACALLCDSRKEFYGHSPMYAYLIRGRTK